MYPIVAVIVFVLAVVLALAVRPRRDDLALDPPQRLQSVGRLAFWVAAALAIGLALTGFYAVFVTRELITGRVLLLHVSLGGPLLVVLPALGLLLGERYASSPAVPPLRKIAFWIFLATGLVLGLTILVSMTTLLDAEGMRCMLTLHRWAAVGSFASLIVLLLHR